MTRYVVFFCAAIDVVADNEEEAEEIASDILTLADVTCEAVEEEA